MYPQKVLTCSDVMGLYTYLSRLISDLFTLEKQFLCC